jgi:co-chaperonin GroES (HSP10)
MGKYKDLIDFVDDNVGELIGSRLIIHEIPNEKKTKSGIILPNDHHEYTKGVVIKSGDGCECKCGNEVLYKSDMGTGIKINNKTFTIISETNITFIYNHDTI